MNPLFGLQSMLKTIDKKNIFAPLLHLAAIVFAGILGIGYLSVKGMDKTFGMVSFAFVVIVFIVLSIIFIYIFNKNPQSLQSES